MSRVVLCLAILCLIMETAAHAAPPAQPNIVLILLDNVGQEWFGCYGSESGCTPNIDKLAAQGVRAEHCYTAPVCGPSRTVLLTGRYPHSTGFRLHHDAALYSGGGLDPKREVLFPRLLRKAGYATGITGKWQVNNLYDEPDVLTAHGFAEHLVWPGSVDRDRVSPAEFEHFKNAIRRESVEDTVSFIQRIESRYWNPVFIRQGKRETHPGRFGPDVCQEFALDFIRRRQDQPFFLYYPMLLTHGQTFTEPAVPTPLNRDPHRSHHEMFPDMLRYADKLVGEVVAEIEKLHLRDHTIFIIASDNGTEKSFSMRRNGRLVQGGLYTLTEAGSDVVLLANCPTLIPGGRVLPLIDFTDIYPTVCELAGGIPTDPNHKVDGRSFSRFVLSAEAAPPRDWILNEYHTTRVVRDTRFKLYSDGRFFDANADPEEQHDLGKDQDSAMVAARQKLEAVLKSLPPDAPPPFLLLSQSGFKIRNEERAKAAK